MMPGSIFIYKTINELMKDNNTTINELADYLKLSPETLSQKLTLDPITRESNKFTLIQITKIAEFFNCNLDVNFITYDEKKKYHCETVWEGMAENHERMGCLYKNKE